MGILAKLSQARGAGEKDNFLRHLSLTAPQIRRPGFLHTPSGPRPAPSGGGCQCPCQRFWTQFHESKPVLFPQLLFSQKQEEVTGRVKVVPQPRVMRFPFLSLFQAARCLLHHSAPGEEKPEENLLTLPCPRHTPTCSPHAWVQGG